MLVACEKRSGWMAERPPHVLLDIIGAGNPLTPNEPLLEIVPAKEHRAVIGKGGNPIEAYRDTNIEQLNRRERKDEQTVMRLFIPHVLVM